MSRVTRVNGDLLDHFAKYICHQCNCRTNTVKGLALDIFDKFPWADITKKRRDVKRLGGIDIRGDGKDQRYVINMFAQYYPGKPRPKTIDSVDKRKGNFARCLKEITEIEDIDTIAFPHGIGCGLAGGDWEWYEKAIELFAKERQDVEVFIVRYNDD